MENMHKLIIILLNYLKYMNVPLDELLNYLLEDDDEGKRQLCLLLDYECECLDEVPCFTTQAYRNDFVDEFEMEI